MKRSGAASPSLGAPGPSSAFPSQESWESALSVPAGGCASGGPGSSCASVHWAALTSRSSIGYEVPSRGSSMGRPPTARFRRARGVAQPGRALGSGPRGRRFESCLPDRVKGSESLRKPSAAPAPSASQPSGDTAGGLRRNGRRLGFRHSLQPLARHPTVCRGCSRRHWSCPSLSHARPARLGAHVRRHLKLLLRGLQDRHRKPVRVAAIFPNRNPSAGRRLATTKKATKGQCEPRPQGGFSSKIGRTPAPATGVLQKDQPQRFPPPGWATRGSAAGRSCGGAPCGPPDVWARVRRLHRLATAVIAVTPSKTARSMPPINRPGCASIISGVMKNHGREITPTRPSVIPSTPRNCLGAAGSRRRVSIRPRMNETPKNTQTTWITAERSCGGCSDGNVPHVPGSKPEHRSPRLRLGDARSAGNVEQVSGGRRPSVLKNLASVRRSLFQECALRDQKTANPLPLPMTLSGLLR